MADNKYLQYSEMIILHLLITLTATIIGAISGIGGGIIIKPVLDSFGLSSIAAINFLSGCTVLVMSAVSLLRNGKSGPSINKKVGGLLASSGIVGGITGKLLFNQLLSGMTEVDNVKLIQSALLMLLTVGVLIFTLNKHRISPLNLKNPVFSLFSGLILGLTGAFLGIGGGPINLLVLYLFFGMDSKTAAANSLFIIFFSQLSSLFFAAASGKIPEFNIAVMISMIIGGVAGALIGTGLSRKLSNRGVDKLFIVALTIIILISIRNIIF